MGLLFLEKEESRTPTYEIQVRTLSLGLFMKGKNCIIAQFHRTGLVTCSHSRDGKTPSHSNSQINMVL